MKTTPEQMGKHIQALREHKKMTLRQLADAIQVNYTALNKIENGAQRLDMDTLAKLVDYFEVKADYFLNTNMKLEDSFVKKDSDHKQLYRGAFIKIMDGYLAAKEQPFAKNPLGNFVRNEMVEILNREIPIDSKKYLVTGSVGQGVWATIPWISCFDRAITTSATNGYYVVYLFKADMSGVFISLNQGYTYFKEKYGAKQGREKIQHTAKLIRLKVDVPEEFKLEKIDLGSTKDLAVGYERGHIYGKYYDLNNLPTDKQMIEDFNVLLEAYKKIAIFMNGRDVKNFNDYLLLQDDLEFLETDEETYQQKANEMANEAEIQNLLFDEDTDEGPRAPKDLVTDEAGKPRYPRSAKEAAKALVRANYRCEINPGHETFISKSTGQRYMEAHHFVGISHHEKFPEVDLDRSENIVCLCSSCHRMIHHAVDETRLPLIQQLFTQIKERLERVGIETTLTQLKSFYGIDFKK